MEILWLAIVFYTIGLAIVLYIRPSLMFNENGTWKEFGYQKKDTHTLFPLWLFSVVWAFGSYALAATVIWHMPMNGALVSASVATMNMGMGPSPDWRQPEYDGESESDLESESESEFGSRSGSGSGTGNAANVKYTPTPVSKKTRGRPRKAGAPLGTTGTTTIRPGFYVLDPKTQDGIRKYVYYGTQRPTDVPEEDFVEQEPEPEDK